MTKNEMSSNDMTTIMLILVVMIIFQLYIFKYAFNKVLPKLSKGNIQPITLVESACILILSSMIFGQCCNVIRPLYNDKN